MSKESRSRRRVLIGSIGVPVGLLLGRFSVVGAKATEPGKVCADPKTIDSAQRSVRESLHFAETSGDPLKTCSRCTFFQAGADGCGNCMILNGPANAAGHCDSWNAKD
jgi:hypothetical protein